MAAAPARGHEAFTRASRGGPRLATSMAAACSTCRSPLASDQRYCLECGTRSGPPRLDWRTMVAVDSAATLEAARVALGVTRFTLARSVAVLVRAGVVELSPG